VFETRAGRIDQHDAAVTPAGSAFDKLTECSEYFRHRMAARHHFEQPLLTGEQSFSALPVVDVSLQYVPALDTTLGVTKRQTACMEPAIVAVSTAHAVLDVVRFPCVYRSLPCSNYHGKIIRMNGIGNRDVPVRERSPYQSRKGIHDAEELFLHSRSFRDIRRATKVRQSRANVYHTLVSVRGEAEAIALRESNRGLDVGGYVARSLILLNLTPLSCVTCFVEKLLEEQDRDVLREGIRQLSEALMETEV
jgi:hypothetical protein